MSSSPGLGCPRLGTILRCCWLPPPLRCLWLAPTLRCRWLASILRCRWLSPVLRCRWLASILRCRWLTPTRRCRWLAPALPWLTSILCHGRPATGATSGAVTSPNAVEEQAPQGLLVGVVPFEEPQGKQISPQLGTRHRYPGGLR